MRSHNFERQLITALSLSTTAPDVRFRINKSQTLFHSLRNLAASISKQEKAHEFRQSLFSTSFPVVGNSEVHVIEQRPRSIFMHGH